MISDAWKDRSAALGILASVILCVAEVVVLPVANSIQDSESSIEKSSESIARYKAIIADIPRLRGDLERAKAKLNAEPLLTGSTTPEVNADLQARVRKLASAAGAIPQDIRILAPTRDGPLSKFELQLELRSTPDQIALLAKGSEALDSRVAIDSLSVNVPESGEGQRDGRGQPITNATVQISGYSLLQYAPARRP